MFTIRVYIRYFFYLSGEIKKSFGSFGAGLKKLGISDSSIDFSTDLHNIHLLSSGLGILVLGVRATLRKIYYRDKVALSVALTHFTFQEIKIKMLVNPKALKNALNNLNARNNLIRELTSQFKKEKNIFKGVFSFWLGSNTLLNQLQTDNLPVIIKQEVIQESLPYVLIGYHCVLILDKHISILAPNEIAFDLLQDCLMKIMSYYNDHFLLLSQNPRELFLQFKSILNEIDDVFTETVSRGHIVLKIKYACLDLIDQALEFNIKNKCELVNTSKRLEEFSTPGMVRNFTSWFINSVITFSHKRYPFFKNLPKDLGNYQHQKIFIKGKDGMILDGLHIRKNHSRAKTVVLALIGHFQVEHDYLTESLVDFYKMFNTDTVFINHRNYAMRAYYLATDINELAQDVVQFAEHFQKQQKRIVLYGMCGGASPMLLAANILKKNNVPFKLILDRFSKKYSNWGDYKSMTRYSSVMKFNKITIGFFHFAVLALVFLLFRLMSQIFLTLTNTNIDFGNKVPVIPENDLLILQTKSKKPVNLSEPLYTDLLVHPKNDLRAVMKSTRQQNKDILKNLRKYCMHITCLYVESTEVQNIFLDLMDCFDKCLQLIDNEKLKLAEPASDKIITDLHAYKLYQLTTRHELPISNFLNGFFAKSQKICDLTLSTLKTNTADRILTALQLLHPEQENKKNSFVEIAGFLENFLTEIKKNEHFVCHMGNRLFATGLGNINLPLQALLNCKLYQISCDFSIKPYSSMRSEFVS